MASSRVALVTGGNRGLGLNIVRQLVYKKWRVIMAARNMDKAQAALKEEFDDNYFPRRNVDVLQLDITDPSSIETATNYIKQTYDSKINILVNNASIAFRSNQFNQKVVNETINTNFYGTMNVTKAMAPFVTDRILFMSSRSGALQQYSQKRIAQFTDANLTEDSLIAMVEEYKTDTKDIKNGDIEDELAIEQKGWTLNAYSLSKAAISMYSRVLANDLYEKQNRRIFVGAYCPGFCRTEMTQFQGERSAVEGAYGLTTLATMLLDHDEDHVKRKQHNLKEGDLLPFDAPNGSFWTSFFLKEGDLNSIELETIDWVNPAKTLNWNVLLQDLVIRKGKGVISIDDQASP